jgi:hypothetical protein
MAHRVSLLGAAALGILVSSHAQAQTVHHRAHHPAAASHPAADGRQITVRKGVEPWLTLGTWAPVGSRNSYALDTLRPPQRNVIQGTFDAGRGWNSNRMPNDIYLPQANRPLITVSSPGLSEPLFSWY